MRLLLLGGSGMAGREIVRAAMTLSDEVVALASGPSGADAFEVHEGLTVVAGEPTDADVVRQAADGADVAVVVLDADGRTPGVAPDELSGVLDALDAAGVPHGILVSAFGVGESAGLASWRARAIYRTLSRRAHAATELAHNQVQGRRTTWATLLPVRLSDGMPHRSHAIAPLGEVRRIVGLPLLPYANLAVAVVDLAHSAEFAGETVVVSSVGGIRLRRVALRRMT